MAKIHAKKRAQIEKKKANEAKQQNQINPFELRHNKIKHRILGRKIGKNESGKPLINRNRAYKKREQTLLKEYENKHKTGKGVCDLREQDFNQRLIEKYRQEQQRIDLDQNDRIELTHKGRPLDEMIDDRVDSDDEQLDLFTRDDYVESSHFGGGELGSTKSRNEILEEIVAEKSRIKHQQEETIKLTQKLDDQWNEIRNIIRHKGSNESNEHDKKISKNDYDTLLSQLVFDDKHLIKNSNTASAAAKSSNDDQSPDAQFKAKLNLIENTNNVDQILTIIKEMIDLLQSKITKKSLIILQEKLFEMSEKSLRFVPKELAILIASSYFKELQTFVQMIILRTLNKIKYKNLNEISCAIFLINFLIKITAKNKYCSELFTHTENLLRLCLPQEMTQIHLFHHVECETECILNVSKYSKASTNDSSDQQYKVSLKNLFEEKFKSNDDGDPSIIKYNLIIQIFEIISSLIDKFSANNLSRFVIKPIIDLINDKIYPSLDSEILRNISKEILLKFDNTKLSNGDDCSAKIIAKKPFILPLLEPKLDEKDLYLKPRYQNERKKLMKKYKREFKGAQREIRKDSKFLRDTFLKEMEKKDNIRKNKVKEILKDLSIQQGLYKKNR